MGTIEYWKYWQCAGDSTATTSCGSDWSNVGTLSATGTWNLASAIRKYVVRTPESWGEKAVAGFVSLLNDKTKIANVEMVIHGDIKITDPSIEVRTMKNFVPLLRQRAGKDDWAKIEQFFEEHGEE